MKGTNLHGYNMYKNADLGAEMMSHRLWIWKLLVSSDLPQQGLSWLHTMRPEVFRGPRKPVPTNLHTQQNKTIPPLSASNLLIFKLLESHKNSTTNFLNYINSKVKNNYFGWALKILFSMENFQSWYFCTLRGQQQTQGILGSNHANITAHVWVCNPLC